MALKQDEDKIGTSVTYSDPQGTKQPIRMGEVTFMPGEAVNLAEQLGEERAKEMARKLAKNGAFQVEGGPDHKKQLEARQRHEEEVTKKQQELLEREQKAQQERSQQQQQPPAGWKGPDQPELEHQQAERRRVK